MKRDPIWFIWAGRGAHLVVGSKARPAGKSWVVLWVPPEVAVKSCGVTMPQG